MNSSALKEAACGTATEARAISAEFIVLIAIEDSMDRQEAELIHWVKMALAGRMKKTEIWWLKQGFEVARERRGEFDDR